LGTTRTEQHRDPDRLECRRCLAEGKAGDLDGLLWCGNCRTSSRRTAARWGRLIGLAAGLALALWVGLVAARSDRFLIFWIAAILISYRLVARLGQELVYGAMRIWNRPGVAAAGDGRVPE
jgi:hypothetical protein